MKKLIIALFFIANLVHAQTSKFKTLPVAIIKFEPQKMIRNGLKMGVEFFNQDHKFSNQIMFEGIYKSDNLLQIKNKVGIVKRSGFLVDYQFKYYFNGLKVEKKLLSESIRGFYAGMAVNAGSYTQTQGMFYTSTNTSIYTYKAVDFKNTIYNFSVIGGIQKELSNRVYLDFYLGAGMQAGSLSYNISDIDDAELASKASFDFGLGLYSRGIIPRGGITLGLGI